MDNQTFIVPFLFQYVVLTAYLRFQRAFAEQDNSISDFHYRNYSQRYVGGGIKGGNAHQAVNAAFVLQIQIQSYD